MEKSLIVGTLNALATDTLVKEKEAKISRNTFFDALFNQLPKTEVLLSQNSKAIGFTTPHDLVHQEYDKIIDNGPTDTNIEQGNGNIVIEFTYKNEDYSSIAITENSVSVIRFIGELSKQIITVVKEYSDNKWMANIAEYENKEHFIDEEQNGYQKRKQKK